MTRLTGLAPLVSDETVVLILGSFPGGQSLARRQYYAHPQNHFWPLLEAIWPASPHADCVDRYEIRSKWLLARGLGLWDVYAECEREGSLDANIRDPRVNDLAAQAGPLVPAVVERQQTRFVERWNEALAAASAAYWGLRLTARPPGMPAPTAAPAPACRAS